MHAHISYIRGVKASLAGSDITKKCGESSRTSKTIVDVCLNCTKPDCKKGVCDDLLEAQRKSMEK